MRATFSFLLAFGPTVLVAEPLRIVTDIAPIHALVSQIAGDSATIDVLVEGDSSPHDFQFTFQQADTLQQADLVVWVGPGLTPWLEEALDTLAQEATRLTLLETDGWTVLPVRDWDSYGDEHHDEAGHAHDHEDTHDDAHDSDHGNDHGDVHKDDHDADHADDHADAHGHDHGPLDPHAWLDPQIAASWALAIQTALAQADPDNADSYAQSAEAAVARLTALDQSIAAQLTALPDAAYLVPHDAYQYFGARYGRPAAGVITLVDDQPPTPERLERLQARVRAGDVACVLTDKATGQGWSDLLTEGTQARTAPVDPLGRDVPTGAGHYEATLQALADALSDCIGG